MAVLGVGCQDPAARSRSVKRRSSGSTSEEKRRMRREPTDETTGLQCESGDESNRDETGHWRKARHAPRLKTDPGSLVTASGRVRWESSVFYNNKSLLNTMCTAEFSGKLESTLKQLICSSGSRNLRYSERVYSERDFYKEKSFGVLIDFNI